MILDQITVTKVSGTKVFEPATILVSYEDKEMKIAKYSDGYETVVGYSYNFFDTLGQSSTYVNDKLGLGLDYDECKLLAEKLEKAFE